MNRWHVLEKLQLVTNRLLHLQTPELEENDRCLSDETEKIGFYKRDFGMEEWDWPQGVGLFGLSKLQSLYHDNRYEAYISSWMDRQVNNGIPCRNINTTAPLLTLMDAEKKRGFLQTMDELAAKRSSKNRRERLPACHYR